MATTISHLNLILTANSRRLSRDLQRANRIVQRDLERIRRETDRHFNRLARVGLTAIAAGATAAVAGITVAINRARQDIDNLAKDASRLDIAIDDFQALSLAAEEAGASTSSVRGAVARLQEQIANATNGNQSAIESFDALGLSWERLAELNPFEALLTAGDALQAISGNANQFTRLGRQIFSDQFTDLAVLFRGGIRGATAETSQFIRGANAAITPQGAVNVQKMNDSLGRLSYAFGGITRQLTETLSPAIKDVSDRMTAAFGNINVEEFGNNLKVEIERIAPKIAELIEKFDQALQRLDLNHLVDSVISALQRFINFMTDPLMIEGVTFFLNFLLRVSTFVVRTMQVGLDALRFIGQFLIDFVQSLKHMFDPKLSMEDAFKELNVSFKETAEIVRDGYESIAKAWEAYGLVPEVPMAFGGQMIARRLAKRYPSQAVKDSKDNMLSHQALKDELKHDHDALLIKRGLTDGVVGFDTKSLDDEISEASKKLAEATTLLNIEKERHKELVDRFRHVARLTGGLAGGAATPMLERLVGVQAEIERAKELENQLQQQIQSMKSKRDAALKQATAPPEESTMQVDPDAYADRLKEITQEADNLIERINTNFASRTESYATLFGEQFERARKEVTDLQDRMVAIEGIDPSYTKQLNDAIKQINNSEIENLNRSLEEQIEAIDPLTDRWARYRKELDLIEKDKIYSAVEGNVERLRNLMNIIELGFYDVAFSIQNNIGSAVDQVIRTGELNFREFFTSMLQDIASIQARLALFGRDGSGGLIGSIISSIAGAAVGAGTGAAVGGGEAAATAAGSSSNFQALASGGEFFPHRPMMVGERGPELLLPDTGGFVVPNHELQKMGRQQVVVNNHISQGVDKRGLEFALERSKQETIREVFSAIRDGGTARAIVAGA